MIDMSNPGEEFARAAYLKWRRSYRPQKQNLENSVRDRLEDPQIINTTLNKLISDRGWEGGLGEGQIFTNWAEIVGTEIAAHCQPIKIEESRLIIQASATAWANQLKLIAPELLQKINAQIPAVNLSEISILGPHSTTWRKGARTIKNERGPRDTFG